MMNFLAFWAPIVLILALFAFGFLGPQILRPYVITYDPDGGTLWGIVQSSGFSAIVAGAVLFVIWAKAITKNGTGKQT